MAEIPKNMNINLPIYRGPLYMCSYCKMLYISEQFLNKHQMKCIHLKIMSLLKFHLNLNTNMVNKGTMTSPGRNILILAPRQPSNFSSCKIIKNYRHNSNLEINEDLEDEQNCPLNFVDTHYETGSQEDNNDEIVDLNNKHIIIHDDIDNMNFQQNKRKFDWDDYYEEQKMTKLVENLIQEETETETECPLVIKTLKSNSISSSSSSSAKGEKKIGKRCTSLMCLKSKKRFCNTITENVRNEIFDNFWKNMNTDQKKVFVYNHVSLQNTSRKRTDNKESRRQNTLIYTLYNGKEVVQVCRTTFLNTTGLGYSTVENWVKNQ